MTLKERNEIIDDFMNHAISFEEFESQMHIWNEQVRRNN
jgi:hypothetical protein